MKKKHSDAHELFTKNSVINNSLLLLLLLFLFTRSVWFDEGVCVFVYVTFLFFLLVLLSCVFAVRVCWLYLFVLWQQEDVVFILRSEKKKIKPR